MPKCCLTLRTKVLRKNFIDTSLSQLCRVLLLAISFNHGQSCAWPISRLAFLHFPLAVFQRTLPRQHPRQLLQPSLRRTLFRNARALRRMPLHLRGPEPRHRLRGPRQGRVGRHRVSSNKINILSFKISLTQYFQPRANSLPAIFRLGSIN